MQIIKIEIACGVDASDCKNGTGNILLCPRTTPGYGIVVKAIVMIPQGSLLFTRSKGHSIADQNEVLKEL